MSGRGSFRDLELAGVEQAVLNCSGDKCGFGGRGASLGSVLVSDPGQVSVDCADSDVQPLRGQSFGTETDETTRALLPGGRIIGDRPALSGTGHGRCILRKCRNCVGRQSLEQWCRVNCKSDSVAVTACCWPATAGYGRRPNSSPPVIPSLPNPCISRPSAVLPGRAGTFVECRFSDTRTTISGAS